MASPLLNKSRLGFSIAFISVLTFIGVLGHRLVATSRDTLTYVCIGAAVLGSLLWVVGQLIQSLRKQDDVSVERNLESTEGEVAPCGHWLSELTSLRHLGFVLIASGACVFCLIPKQGAEQDRVTVVAAKPLRPSSPAKTSSPKVKSQPAKTNPAPATAESPSTPAVELPKLKLGGIIMNGAASTAVINGITVQTGDRLDEVNVVAIEPTTVTVETSGKRIVLRLDK